MKRLLTWQIDDSEPIYVDGGPLIEDIIHALQSYLREYTGQKDVLRKRLKKAIRDASIPGDGESIGEADINSYVEEILDSLLLLDQQLSILKKDNPDINKQEAVKKIKGQFSYLLDSQAGTVSPVSKFMLLAMIVSPTVMFIFLHILDMGSSTPGFEISQGMDIGIMISVITSIVMGQNLLGKRIDYNRLTNILREVLIESPSIPQALKDDLEQDPLKDVLAQQSAILSNMVDGNLDLKDLVNSGSIEDFRSLVNSLVASDRITKQDELIIRKSLQEFEQSIKEGEDWRDRIDEVIGDRIPSRFNLITSGYIPFIISSLLALFFVITFDMDSFDDEIEDSFMLRERIALTIEQAIYRLTENQEGLESVQSRQTGLEISEQIPDTITKKDFPRGAQYTARDIEMVRGLNNQIAIPGNGQFIDLENNPRHTYQNYRRYESAFQNRGFYLYGEGMGIYGFKLRSLHPDYEVNQDDFQLTWWPRLGAYTIEKLTDNHEFDEYLVIEWYAAHEAEQDLEYPTGLPLISNQEAEAIISIAQEHFGEIVSPEDFGESLEERYYSIMHSRNPYHINQLYIESKLAFFTDVIDQNYLSCYPTAIIDAIYEVSWFMTQAGESPEQAIHRSLMNQGYHSNDGNITGKERHLWSDDGDHTPTQIAEDDFFTMEHLRGMEDSYIFSKDAIQSLAYLDAFLAKIINWQTALAVIVLLSFGMGIINYQKIKSLIIYLNDLEKQVRLQIEQKHEAILRDIKDFIATESETEKADIDFNKVILKIRGEYLVPPVSTQNTDTSYDKEIIELIESGETKEQSIVGIIKDLIEKRRVSDHVADAGVLNNEEQRILGEIIHVIDLYGIYKQTTQ